MFGFFGVTAREDYRSQCSASSLNFVSFKGNQEVARLGKSLQ